MITTELLPCPFCGGEAHFAASSDGYAVECDGELCVRNAMQEHPSEEYAALWWNTRSITAAAAYGYQAAQGTCDQDWVRDLVERHSDGLGGNARAFHNGAYARIAEEMTAALGMGECEYEFVPSIGGGHLDACGLRCSSCGREQMSLEPPNYCPDCGRRVVDDCR